MVHHQSKATHTCLVANVGIYIFKVIDGRIYVAIDRDIICSSDRGCINPVIDKILAPNMFLQNWKLFQQILQNKEITIFLRP